MADAIVDEELDELEEIELDDLDEEEAEETEVKTDARAVKFGTRELANYIEEEIGREYQPKELRVLLRKMARAGELDHEVKQGGGKRYSWDGPDDPEVQAILARVQGGEIEDARQEALDKLKERQTLKREAKQMAPDKVAEQSIPDLKEICKVHKISLRGITKKSELVQRIIDELELTAEPEEEEEEILEELEITDDLE